MEEVLADQIKWMRAKEEQEQRAEGHTIAEEAHQQQDHNRDNKGTQLPFSLLRHTHDTGNNMVNDNDNDVIPFELCEEFNNTSTITYMSLLLQTMTHGLGNINGRSNGFNNRG
jgi:hypothetical protein